MAYIRVQPAVLQGEATHVAGASAELRSAAAQALSAASSLYDPIARAQLAGRVSGLAGDGNREAQNLASLLDSMGATLSTTAVAFLAADGASASGMLGAFHSLGGKANALLDLLRDLAHLPQNALGSILSLGGFLGSGALPGDLITVLSSGWPFVASQSEAAEQASYEMAFTTPSFAGADAPSATVVFGGMFVVVTGISVAALIFWCNQDLEGLSEDEAQAKLEGILKRDPAGREALQTAEELDVGMGLSSPGAGSAFHSDTNTFFIDPQTNPDLAAMTYIHEVTHARQHDDDRFPDPTAVDREQYVEAFLALEAEARIEVFRYEKERPLLDHWSSSPEEEAFWAAYDAELADVQPGVSEGERLESAYAAGKEAILEYYRDGSIVTSTTGESYVDYFGTAWLHSQPGWTDDVLHKMT